MFAERIAAAAGTRQAVKECWVCSPAAGAYTQGGAR